MGQKLFERWGWYLIVDAIAEGGRFVAGGLSPIDSANVANFYEAMMWYAKEKNVSEQQAILAKQND
jgi:hypothetical protein